MGLNNDPNLEFLAKFNGDTVDASGKGSDGIVSGNVTFADGKFDQAATSPGVESDVVEFLGRTNLDFTSENFTAACWFNRDATGADYAWLFAKLTADVSGWGVMLRPNGICYFYTYQVGVNQTSRFTVPGGLVNSWHHVAWVRQGSVATAYLDGLEISLDGAGVHIDPLVSTAEFFIFNKDKITNQATKGLLDDVRIYSRVLSAAEILKLATAPYAPAPTGFAANAAGTDQINLTWSDV